MPAEVPPHTLPVKHKVIAYITGRRGSLLVFSHPDFPEAGIQVPAGTVEAGEAPEIAVLREAQEETGLTALTVAEFLGERKRDMSDFGKPELHFRHYFHLWLRAEAPETWEHWETDPADGGPPVRFAFFWAQLPDGVSELIADHDALLPALIARLA